MDIADIRAEFKRFAGPERFRKFVRFVSNECREKGRLFYWQEQLWEEFESKFPKARLSAEEILRAFCICDVHGAELEDLPPADSSGKIRSTPEYDQAEERLFPLARGRYLSCLQCQSERQTWIIENPEQCRILRFKTTCEDYCRRQLDGIADAEARADMIKQAEPRIKEQAASQLFVMAKL